MGAGAIAMKLIAGRWIAGPGIGDAIALSGRLNSANISAILNYLGEDLVDKAMVRDAVSTYLRLIDSIKSNRIKASISLKPSQIGLSVSYATAKKNYSRIVSAARGRGVTTWLDMEAHETVDDTIRMYLSELRKGMVGICLQSCLRRSMNDLKEISEMKGTVRLVKGAYKEDGYGAFPTRQQTTQNYSRMVRYLFRSFEGRNFMIATHDPRMMEQAFRLERITGKKPMYAMLNGIRNNYAAKLARHNDVSLYVPFGSAWVPYAIRRLREEGHLGLLLRSLFEQQDLV